MSEIVIAVPSMAPGGLEALRSAHFGRCDAFTLVSIRQGQVAGSRIVANAEHREGGCLVPVRVLHREGANSVVVGGIGMRPLRGLQEVGIQVLVGPGESVREVVDAYLSGLVRPVAGSDVCGAHHHG